MSLKEFRATVLSLLDQRSIMFNRTDSHGKRNNTKSSLLTLIQSRKTYIRDDRGHVSFRFNKVSFYTMNDYVLGLM